ncbi:hypothetical protein BD413DRAFT_566680 [Trametes elegans]|nr:hypothetical protein BD413DRAFT_566680 [Trametes elegans]
MPGANYMGGKRNAARARIKDATGKVQRDHFGKKRFEILRTGLSKGNVSAGQVRQSREGLPEISFAHARRDRGGEEHQESPSLSTWVSPITSISRRSLFSSASSRSMVLRALDAEDPVSERTRVVEILSNPDLLGLTSVDRRRRETHVHNIEKLTSYERTRPHPSGPSRMIQSPPRAFIPDNDPVTLPCLGSPWSHERSRSSPMSTRPAIDTGWNARASSTFYSDAAFIPIPLDSSPVLRADDSGYSEAWEYEAELRASYGSTRLPFHLGNGHGLGSPAAYYPGLDGLPTMPSYSRFSSFDSLPFESGEPTAPAAQAYAGDSRGSSPTHLQLPAAMAQARFLSDLPTPTNTSPILEGSSFLPSSIPDFSLSKSISLHWGSDDIPQASFSLSPPTQVALYVGKEDDTPRADLACDTGYFSDTQSVDYARSDYLDDATPGDILLRSLNNPTSLDLADNLHSTFLADLLDGSLFEDADPWCALDSILCLPRMPLGVPAGSDHDPLVMTDAYDRRGVGYLPSINPQPSWLSQNTEDNPDPEQECASPGCFGFPEPTMDVFLSPESACLLTPEPLYSSRHTPPLPVVGNGHLLSGEARVSAASCVEDPMPSPASPQPSELQASLDPPVGHCGAEHEEAREVMSPAEETMSIELPSTLKWQSAAEATPVPARRERHCSQAVITEDSGLVDGPSLFLDFGPPLSEEE